jgi:hypothetical protein
MNDSPSFFFHEAIPPSVMVGLIAGIVNFDSACLRAETCRSIENKTSVWWKAARVIYAYSVKECEPQMRPLSFS